MPKLIMPCSCKHTYQDQKYGVGLRLHNYTKHYPNKTTGGWRCTVCTQVKPA